MKRAVPGSERVVRPPGVCDVQGAVLISTGEAGIGPGKPLPPEGVVRRESRPDLVGGR
ncbi:hypothetical protein [Methanoculleus sp. 10]|uniref:hypothetical protein n=1 Tax=Methanoculleus sp. 10 TaxID=430615 RepID=UPI001B4227E6|nr:hypothetical protein [Methanoculleus sp. 10]MBP7410935.1 hypothetical protein [Methanoculleus sp.]